MFMKKLCNIYITMFFFLIAVSCKTDVKKEEIKKSVLTTFNFKSKEPVDGKLYGVVELGAAGFNSFIVNVDKNLNWKLEKVEYGTSLLVEGMTNAMLVNEKLRQYLESLTSEGIGAEDIYFVVSSGAIKEEITKIIIEELKKIGYKVNSVTPYEEGAFALKAILPKEYEQNSFVVDIGSGNTKISYLDAQKGVKTIECIGAKYYQKGFEDEEVYKKVREATSAVPLEKRKKCFIIGGVPTQMAKVLYPTLAQYNVLSADIEAYKAVKGKKAESGINIFKAIQDETNVEQAIYFLDGNFAVGFLLDKIK